MAKAAVKPFLSGAEDKDRVEIGDVQVLVLPPIDWQDSPRTGGPRSDRVVAMVNERLCLFTAGSAKPLGSCDALTDVARAAVWNCRLAAG